MEVHLGASRRLWVESGGVGRCGRDEQQGKGAVREPLKGNLQHLGLWPCWEQQTGCAPERWWSAEGLPLNNSSRIGFLQFRSR